MTQIIVWPKKKRSEIYFQKKFVSFYFFYDRNHEREFNSKQLVEIVTLIHINTHKHAGKKGQKKIGRDFLLLKVA